MKIGIITYNRAHFKTQELVSGLISAGYKNITLIIKNFKTFKNKKKIIHLKHRPFEFTGPNYDELSKFYNLKIKLLKDSNCFKSLDIVLIGGASIIEEEKIKKNFIINCHSGLIPETRGLDGLKWAIFNNKKVGTTLHYIDKNVDDGKLISHEATPIFRSDTFETFALRHYRQEINMLINFENYLNYKKIIKLSICDVTKRMPLKEERKIIKKFITWKKNFIK